MMIFAALSHALFGIPTGDMRGDYPSLPDRTGDTLKDVSLATSNLLFLADMFDTSADSIPERLGPFKVAIAGTTQRIKSRSVRFTALYRALQPEPI